MYKVLYLDSDSTAVVNMAPALKDRGLIITARESIDEALAEFLQGEFDAVLLEIVMPPTEDMLPAAVGNGRETGLEVARRLKKQKPNVPVIALTVVNDPDIKARTHPAGICRIINKPPEMARIADDVLNVLDPPRPTTNRAIMLGEDLANLRVAATPGKELYYLQKVSQSADLLHEPTLKELADRFLCHPHPPLRGEMCYLLAMSGHTEYLDRVQACMADDDPWVREEATKAVQATKRYAASGRRGKYPRHRKFTMPQGPCDGLEQATVYRVFIACPSDVNAEKTIIREVVGSWNAAHSRKLKVMLQAVSADTDSLPLGGERPQALINRELVDQCQILVAVFWTTLGTPTGFADSGTVEEISRFENSGKPALLYFSDCPAPPHQIDLDQLKRLREYRDLCRPKRLYQEYESIGDFRELLQRQVAQLVDSLTDRTAAP